ncbi:restriction endonuclease subunit S [Pseudorhizobium flavum]|uniref:Type I restriction enzyme S subunit n=1 Tax=Pseudorhizobium flavum TaxID=1335061 RepID=A0A7X0DAT4_9HYPH|nr:restriction endonuclease subunit S [Pseudorhizobium flavum]MBB6178082.1 type I restriction enzyme S subunit [Pseudorhizobium flavum]CAD6615025.1 restriction endonuclease subunit S [Pseudorhizobium flavum]
MVKAGYKQTEVGEIPEDWELNPIGQHFDFKNGLNKSKEYFGHGTPIINYMDVFSNPGLANSDITGKVAVTKDEINSYSARKGDVFFTRTSETVDEIGLSTVLTEEVKDAVFSGFVLRAREKGSDLGLHFKKYCFRSESARKQIKATSSYTTRALTNGKLLSQVLLAYPKDPDEQKAIADALSDVDTLIASLAKLIEKKRDIKTATMQQLLTGKKRLPGFQKEWQIKKIEELADIDPENLSSTTNPLYEFRYVSLEDVDSGRLRGHSEQIFSTSPSRARRVLRMNDVVIATVRPNLKSHFLFQRNEKDWICSTGFAVIRCNPKKADAQFLFYHFFARQIDLQIETLIAGSNYPAINSGDVRKLEISCPEIDEQAAIASVISDMDKELHLLEEKRSKAKAIKQGMMQELLTGRTRLV